MTRTSSNLTRHHLGEYGGALGSITMNLRQIEAFLAVFEEGAFSAGAARLKVAQPTVSKPVDALERTGSSARWLAGRSTGRAG